MVDGRTTGIIALYWHGIKLKHRENVAIELSY